MKDSVMFSDFSITSQGSTNDFMLSAASSGGAVPFVGFNGVYRFNALYGLKHFFTSNLFLVPVHIIGHEAAQELAVRR